MIMPTCAVMIEKSFKSTFIQNAAFSDRQTSQVIALPFL